jgi:hypothetical protein
MQPKIYAGIGSRETPRSILDIMSVCASKLEALNYTLRSGHAIGADSAFESYVSNKEIFVADDATLDAIELASHFHGYWDKCSVYAKKLHGRNSMILLGKNLDTPVRFVICWTKDGKDTGGTGLGIRIAEAYNIPIFNLYNYDTKIRLLDFIGMKSSDIDVL